MQVSSVLFGSILPTSQTAKTSAAAGFDMSWADAAPADGASTARSQFDAYIKMTPAEKMHAAMLARLGMTEEEFKALDPDKRQAIEEKITEMIKQDVENGVHKGKTGVFADVKV